jgi:hypothetical protein
MFFYKHNPIFYIHEFLPNAENGGGREGRQPQQKKSRTRFHSRAIYKNLSQENFAVKKCDRA